MGLPQGSVLSPVLFNVYLEKAIKSSKKLDEVRARGDLPAFAEYMLVMTNKKAEFYRSSMNSLIYMLDGTLS